MAKASNLAINRKEMAIFQKAWEAVLNSPEAGDIKKLTSTKLFLGQTALDTLTNINRHLKSVDEFRMFFEGITVILSTIGMMALLVSLPSLKNQLSLMYGLLGVLSLFIWGMSVTIEKGIPAPDVSSTAERFEGLLLDLLNLPASLSKEDMNASNTLLGIGGARSFPELYDPHYTDPCGDEGLPYKKEQKIRFLSYFKDILLLMVTVYLFYKSGNFPVTISSIGLSLGILVLDSIQIINSGCRLDILKLLGTNDTRIEKRYNLFLKLYFQTVLQLAGSDQQQLREDWTNFFHINRYFEGTSDQGDVEPKSFKNSIKGLENEPNTLDTGSDIINANKELTTVTTELLNDAYIKKESALAQNLTLIKQLAQKSFINQGTLIGHNLAQLKDLQILLSQAHHFDSLLFHASFNSDLIDTELPAFEETKKQFEDQIKATSETLSASLRTYFEKETNSFQRNVESFAKSISEDKDGNK